MEPGGYTLARKVPKRAMVGRSVTLTGDEGELELLRSRGAPARDRGTRITWDGASSIPPESVLGSSAAMDDSETLSTASSSAEAQGLLAPVEIAEDDGVDENDSKLHRPCAACRQARVLCDRKHPCGRCTRLGLYTTCAAPPTVKRGRPTNEMRQERLEKLAVEMMTGMPAKDSSPQPPPPIPPQMAPLASAPGAPAVLGAPPVTAATASTHNGVGVAFGAPQSTFTTAITGMPHQVHGVGLAPAPGGVPPTMPFAMAMTLPGMAPVAPAPMMSVNTPAAQLPVAPTPAATEPPAPHEGGVPSADDHAKIEALREQLRAAGLTPCV